MLSERSYWLDNIKCLLIFFVVFGHILSQAFTPSIQIYVAIYAFHMPAFAFISGLLVKDSVTSAKKVFFQYFAIYYVFAILYHISFVNHGFNDIPPFTVDVFLKPFIDAPSSLWYLYCLIAWRLVLPAVEKIRFIIPISFIVGLAAGLSPNIGSGFSISRMLVFFPYFLLGYKLKYDRFSKILTVPNPVKLSVLLLSLISATLLYQFVDFDYTWFFGNTSYKELHAGLIGGIGRRAIVYILAIASGVSFMSLVPTNKCFLSYIGKNSMVVYLLHPFIVQPTETLVLMPMVQHGVISGYGYTAIGFLIAALCTTVLGTNLLHQYINWPFNKISAFFFKTADEKKVI